MSDKPGDKLDRIERNAPRFLGGMMELKEGTGPLTGMCGCNGFMEVYKTDRTFHIYSPEVLDPDVTDPNMPFTASAVSEIGSANKIVARVMLQSERLANSLLPRHLDKDSIMGQLHQCKELLLACESVLGMVEDDVQRIRQQIEQQQIAMDKGGRTLSPFPVVEDLEDRCSRFLVNAKRCIQQLAMIFDAFFQTNIHGPHFHKIKRWVREHIGDNSEISSTIEKAERVFQYVLDLRNYQEHPTPKKQTIIQNFRLQPRLVIGPPAWYVTGSEPADIASDMKYLVDYLLETVEWLFILCLMESNADFKGYQIIQIPEAERDKDCPIRFKLGIAF